jgi:hypothetical protein
MFCFAWVEEKIMKCHQALRIKSSPVKTKKQNVRTRDGKQESIRGKKYKIVEVKDDGVNIERAKNPFIEYINIWGDKYAKLPQIQNATDFYFVVYEIITKFCNKESYFYKNSVGSLNKHQAYAVQVWDLLCWASIGLFDTFRLNHEDKVDNGIWEKSSKLFYETFRIGTAVGVNYSVGTEWINSLPRELRPYVLFPEILKSPIITVIDIVNNWYYVTLPFLFAFLGFVYSKIPLTNNDEEEDEIISVNPSAIAMMDSSPFFQMIIRQSKVGDMFQKANSKLPKKLKLFLTAQSKKRSKKKSHNDDQSDYDV